MSFLYASQKGTCKKCVPFVLSAEYNNLSTGRAEIIKSKAENIGRKELSCISSQIGMWFNQTDNCTVGSLKHSVLLDPI